MSIPTNLPLINPIKKLELVRPSSSKTRILNVNSEKDKEQIYERFKFLVKSTTIPKDRVVNYLILCIRGLHYSTQCLKEPSKKFINSRKLKIPQTALSRARSPSQAQDTLPGPRRDDHLPNQRPDGLRDFRNCN